LRELSPGTNDDGARSFPSGETGHCDKAPIISSGEARPIELR
jgi:hypothetical protein